MVAFFVVVINLCKWLCPHWAGMNEVETFLELEHGQNELL